MKHDTSLHPADFQVLLAPNLGMFLLFSNTMFRCLKPTPFSERRVAETPLLRALKSVACKIVTDPERYTLSPMRPRDRTRGICHGYPNFCRMCTDLNLTLHVTE
jgi:hypothetical protein